jgi:hypothetical protein
VKGWGTLIRDFKGASPAVFLLVVFRAFCLLCDKKVLREQLPACSEYCRAHAPGWFSSSGEI